MWSSAASDVVIAGARARIAASRAYSRRVRDQRLDPTERAIVSTQRRISDTLTLLLELAAMSDGVRRVG